MVNTRFLIIGIVIFILILLLIISVLLFLLGSKKKSSGKKKRGKKRKVYNASGRKGGEAGKTSSGKASEVRALSKTVKVSYGGTASGAAKKPGKASGTVPLKLTDDGVEKYARMTEDYTLSKFDVRLERLELKKYYSERHGFYCVDFSYTVPQDISFAVFKGNLNDMDTALSNVSGVDTITFASDGVKPSFRTTFYLNK